MRLYSPLPAPLAPQHDSFVATTPCDIGAVCWSCAKPRTAVVRVACVKSWQGISRVCWTCSGLRCLGVLSSSSEDSSSRQRRFARDSRKQRHDSTMAFAGLKKQINKANQYMTEKMGGAEGTKLDVDFVDMERKTDVTYELVDELQMKTKEFLQPNPTARAKMAAVKGISKLSGQAKASTYPQPEGVLGDCMLMYGKKLGEDSIFAQALIEMGEAMKQMADVKYSLDDNIKQNFLEPLHHLQTKDLKEVMHHRKKLQGRRLDFDCKRRRQAKGSHVSDEEIRQAEEKFAESLHLAQMGMFNLLENDIEQVAQLASFSEALLEYHQQCTEILKGLTETLFEKKEEAMSRPKLEFVPKTLADLHVDSGLSDHMNGGNFSLHASPLPSPSKSPARTPITQPRTPCCTALYDFEPENPGELGFKENDTITLIQKIDENWYEGSLDGRTGYFPVTYVQVVVPLP